MIRRGYVPLLTIWNETVDTVAPCVTLPAQSRHLVTIRAHRSSEYQRVSSWHGTCIDLRICNT